VNFDQIKCPSLILFFIAFMLVCVSVEAQFMDEYEIIPKIRSILQRPVSQTESFISGTTADVPRITEEKPSKIGIEELPEALPLDLPEYYDIIPDKKIDPTQYIVGPGDLIGIYLWGELDLEYELRVKPAGNLIIPTIGSIMVSDITLDEAVNKIKEAASKKYNELDITVSLSAPRRFRLSITGVVNNSGMYVSNSLMRVSDLLGGTRSGRMILIRRPQSSNQSAKKGSSVRSITIFRDEKEITVDLLHFEKMGELDANPYVFGGDNIYVPPYQGDIMISGEVNDGGIYEYKPGDRVCDLVVFGGGLTTIADSSNATLVRYEPDGRNLKYISIDLYDAIFTNPDDTRYILQESDRIFVQTKYDYKVISNVLVGGQVKFPGEYAIIPQVTKLTDVIRMAGGFTDQANLEEARIVKPLTSATRDLEYERLRTMRVEDMSDEEYEFLKQRSRTIANIVTINFVKLFEENDLSHDIFLEAGDHIFIPLKPELVNVLGAVQESGFVKFEEGKDFTYYIEKAGGYNWNAKTRSVRIIKAQTGQRFRPKGNIQIEGGDTIFIPEKKPVNYWEFFKDTMTVFADVATIIIIIERLTE